MDTYLLDTDKHSGMDNPEEPRAEAEGKDVHYIKGHFTFFLLGSCYIEGGIGEIKQNLY